MTAATNGNGTTTVEGVVQRTNGNGIKLRGHAEWLNWSKWAKNPWTPEDGDHVRAILDGSGFIRALEPIAAEPPTSNDTPATTAPDKDTVITRLAVLKAAAEFAAARPDAKSTDVLKIAEAWEAWVTRTA